jgi:hypothetical protein
LLQNTSSDEAIEQPNRKNTSIKHDAVLSQNAAQMEQLNDLMKKTKDKHDAPDFYI